MKNKLSSLLIAIMACAGTIFAESGKCGANLTWNLTDGVLTISGTGPMENYSSSLSVPWYSERADILTVIVNNGVTSIGDHAFVGCKNLTSIRFPNSIISIGSCAFYGCSRLISIEIPNNVTTMGLAVFLDCSSLETISFGKGLNVFKNPSDYSYNNYWNYPILYGCTNLHEIYWNCRDVSAVTGLFSYAEYNGKRNFSVRKQITKFIIGNEVERLPKTLCDEMDNLTKVIIPKSVQIIDKYAFTAEIDTIVLLSTTPPSINKKTCDECGGTFAANTIILVPFGSGIAYSNDYTWGDYHIQPTGVTCQFGEAKPTSCEITITLDKSLGESVLSCNISNDEVFEGNYLECKSLEPDLIYTNIPVEITTKSGVREMVHLSFTTTAISLATQLSKPVSSNTAILLAETNIAEIETSCGFEWKRTNAPDDMEGTLVYCPVANGVMAGRLKGLKDDVYYKYRAFYQSAAGNMYYGNWQYIFTGDATVEFDPIIYTYPATSVKENEATLKGYALAGSEDFSEQGFEYWAESRANKAPRSTAAIGEHHTVTASGISMNATLTDLDAGTVYRYRSYAKIGSKLLYGSEMTLTTQGEYHDPQAIEDIQTDAPQATKVLMDGQIYILRGDKAYTITGQSVR